MLAEKDPIVEKTVNSVYSISQDKIMRDKMEAREEFLKIERTNKWIMEQQEKALAEKDKALANKDKALVNKDKALANKDKALANKDKALVAAKAEIAELKAKLERMDQK